jgi:hypothetical protein
VQKATDGWPQNRIAAIHAETGGIGKFDRIMHKERPHGDKCRLLKKGRPYPGYMAVLGNSKKVKDENAS